MIREADTALLNATAAVGHLWEHRRAQRLARVNRAMATCDETAAERDGFCRAMIPNIDSLICVACGVGCVDDTPVELRAFTAEVCVQWRELLGRPPRPSVARVEGHRERVDMRATEIARAKERAAILRAHNGTSSSSDGGGGSGGGFDGSGGPGCGYGSTKPRNKKSTKKKNEKTRGAQQAASALSAFEKVREQVKVSSPRAGKASPAGKTAAAAEAQKAAAKTAAAVAVAVASTPPSQQVQRMGAKQLRKIIRARVGKEEAGRIIAACSNDGDLRAAAASVLADHAREARMVVAEGKGRR